jgi:riboflavin synthase
VFTGIIETIAQVTDVRPLQGGIEFDVRASYLNEIQVDDSIAHSGVCLTVVRKSSETYTVQAVEETLRKTTLGSIKPGSVLNAERCLTPNSRLDGHIVQGHVDAVGTITEMKDEGSNWLITISFDAEYDELIVGRGSITVDGISLTVAREGKQQFTVAIIPFTWEHTTLHTKKVGDKVNLEFDILGKYVLKYMKKRFESAS